jgi:5-deoxy-D-glucuronate isomerase
MILKISDKLGKQLSGQALYSTQLRGQFFKAVVSYFCLRALNDQLVANVGEKKSVFHNKVVSIPHESRCSIVQCQSREFTLCTRPCSLVVVQHKQLAYYTL